MDTVQFVLLIVIILLTLLLIVLGVQVFLILRDLRRTIVKTNKVLDHANSITGTIEEPLAAISSLAMGFKASSFFTIAKFVKNLLGHEKDSRDKHHKE